jgi:hypothetical protein
MQDERENRKRPKKLHIAVSQGRGIKAAHYAKNVKCVDLTPNY